MRQPSLTFCEKILPATVSVFFEQSSYQLCNHVDDAFGAAKKKAKLTKKKQRRDCELEITTQKCDDDGTTASYL